MKKRIVFFMLLLSMIFFGGGCDRLELYWHASVGTVGWLAGGSDNGYGTILHTKDGGTTWIRQGSSAVIPDCDFNDVAVIDRWTAWVVGYTVADNRAVIVRTIDGGATWERQGLNLSLPGTGLSSISAVDYWTAWSVGDGGTILFTDDGGETWVQQSSPSIPSAPLGCVDAFDSLNVWVAGAEDSGYLTILKTTDGGLTWDRLGSNAPPFQYTSVIDIAVADKNTVFCVGTDTVVLKTTDSGATWNNMSWMPGPKDLSKHHVNAVSALDSETVWVAIDYNQVRISNDGGLQWLERNPQSPPGTYYYVGITALDEKTVWVSGGNVLGIISPQRGIIYHTKDGVNWTEQQTPVNVHYRGISFVGTK